MRVNNKNHYTSIKSAIFSLDIKNKNIIIKPERNNQMKKIAIALCLIISSLPTFGANNVFFGENQNSITIYGAQSTGSGTVLKWIEPGIWDCHPQTLFMAQYSQPMKFFRLDSRLNLNVGQNFAYKSNKGLSFFGIGVSIDSALLKHNGWYVGLGIGPYMRDNMDYWVESRLVFQEKVFIGKNINDKWNVEIFTMHFSNGNFTPVNEGFNFAGISIGYKFW